MSELKIIEEKKVLDLKSNFRIPLYQRPYAWGEDEVLQLIVDLKQFQERNQKNKGYFLGNIVVYKEGGVYDVIDGQQRLTTLYLLLKYLEKKGFNLIYEIRDEDNDFLKKLQHNNWDQNTPCNNCVFYESMKTIDDNLINENKEATTILDNVYVTITEIPKEVDVVKYFEVMNNRGKQLEKHQILKAKFLQTLTNNQTYNWAKIWDYCSEMNSSIEDLIYYNDFRKNERKDGATFNLRKQLLRDFKHNVFNSNDNKTAEIKISDILKLENQKDDSANQEDKDLNSKKEYRSIVKFPIFLIQVLKLFIANSKHKHIDGFKQLKEINVNDRYLLDYFHQDEQHTKFLFDEKDLATEFLLFLLKMRILFDYFIIKRDEREEAVLLSRDNNELIMIELLFNFSAPQYFAQDWIIVLLNWLNSKNIEFEENKIKFADDQVIIYLENFDREMAKIRLSDTKIISFINQKIMKQEQTKEISRAAELGNILNQGTSTPHYWFYKLDYLLWKDFDWKNNLENKFEEKGQFKYLNIKKTFKLSRLNSIEHIFPQSKKENFGNSEDCGIDNFGNLALISNHMNSKLIDQSYENKRADIQKQLSNGTIDSLKMLLVYSKHKEWNSDNCQQHQKEMIDFLKKSLQFNNDYLTCNT